MRTSLAIAFAVLLPASAWADAAQIQRLTSLMLEQEQKLQRLEADVRSLRGEMEVLAHKMEQASRGDRNLYADLDERLRKLESAQPAASAVTTTAPPAPNNSVSAPETPQPATPVYPPTDTAAGTATDTATAQPGNEQAAYQAAFKLLEAGQYQPAINAFRAVLARYPNGEYSDNAQYWLAESYYALRDYRAAQSAFQDLIENHPNSQKRAHAELKLGYVYYELKDKVRAKQILEQVRLHYPGTNTARLAEERLRRLQIEGY
jgi:tol-pal system protein YbgF